MKNTCFFCVICFSFFTVISASGAAKSGCFEKEKALASLETAEVLLSKAKQSFPSCTEDLSTSSQSGCGGNKSLAYIEISQKLISDVRRNFPACPNDSKQDFKPKDCSEILKSGQKASGVYTVWLKENASNGKPLLVYCDMETDKGGWTLIQRRGKFSVQEDFFRDWETYKNGFGNISREFWLGNENIRVLCLGGCKIRFDLQDKAGDKAFALYQSFKLSSESSNYTIHISNYSGNAGSDQAYLNNSGFSTKDKGPQPGYVRFQGGWWYNGGGYSNLNGVYQPGASNITCVYWHTWREFDNLANVEIKVRPN